MAARSLMRRVSHWLSIASLVVGLLVMVFSLIVAGATVSTGLVAGFILVLNGAVRLYAADEG